MTRPVPSLRRRRVALAALGALVIVATLVPGSAIADDGGGGRFIVVLDGDYALDGGYALGDGYALVGQGSLDDQYALSRQYALYALDDVYALAAEYALEADYLGDAAYALFGDYALDSGYALEDDYALGDGYALMSEYALANDYALYALDSTYALTSDYALYALDSGYALSDSYALGDNYALARDYALWLIATAGGVVTSDLSRQLGVMIVDSKNDSFADVISGYALVASVGQDFGWQQFPTYHEAIASGALTLVAPPLTGALGGDPLESQQWNMRQIRAPQARLTQAGSPKVEVGIVDTGIDGTHLDFMSGTGSNVDCERGADFTAVGPGIGTPAACVDNNFHGTHVAGIVAARANGHGVVGVAPNVSLVPIKVCDADGHCYASDVVEGITYAGDLAVDVVNMSFFVDDDEFQLSTEFKCSNDPAQRAFRQATERAIAYIRNQGVTPVAALGNSDADLAHPESGNGCDVVPAETSGVVGTASIGPESEKADYSNWGKGATDVTAPGGDAILERDTLQYCSRQVLSTVPGNAWACFQGTSMASPHATGVVALIISQFGKPDGNGGLTMSPSAVAAHLQNTAVDIGLRGYDACFGNGRIDALRAVRADTSKAYDGSAPFCAEYDE